MTQVRMPRKTPKYGKRTRAGKVYQRGGTFSGTRTRSRYGYTHGSVFRVRTRNSAKHVYSAAIWSISLTGSARIERYYPRMYTGPELKPSTRALNASTLPKPAQNPRNKVIRERTNTRITRFHLKYRYSGGTTKSNSLGITWKDHRRLMNSAYWVGKPHNDRIYKH